MMRSMTAYSRYETKISVGNIIWELRSTNQRYLEIFIQTPKEFYFFDHVIQKYLRNKIKRGRIECSLYFDRSEKLKILYINESLVKDLIQYLLHIKKNINKEFKTNINLLDILNFPGILSHKEKNIENISDELIISLDKIIDIFIVSREKEGIALTSVIEKKLKLIVSEIKKIKQFIPEIEILQRNKLIKKLNEISKTFILNQNHLEQEILLFFQKYDISEELDRLGIHVKEVFYCIKNTKKEPVGKKLNFIMQELHREANTLASKSINTNITMSAITIKVFIEQIREHIQNVE